MKFLKGALGSKAIKSPKFNFHGTNHGQKNFLATSFALENEGVQAYSGQGPRLQNVDYVKAALSILTIEARHAGAIAYARRRRQRQEGHHAQRRLRQAEEGPHGPQRRQLAEVHQQAEGWPGARLATRPEGSACGPAPPRRVSSAPDRRP